MSLLLEALRKAELAKQAAKAHATADEKFALTREHQPDIAQAKESEELRLVDPAPASTPRESPDFELGLAEAPPPATEPAQTQTADAGFTGNDEFAEREQAQRLFAAKGLAADPRKPFYLTLGAVGLFALGVASYFWFELHPGNAFTTPPTVRAPMVASSPEPATPVRIAPAALTARLVPALPVASAPVTNKHAPELETGVADIPPPKPARVRRKARKRPTAPAPAAAARAAFEPAAAITISPSRVQRNPVLENAYRAFNAGDLDRARVAYLQVLRADPNARDALLGMAAVEIQAKHYANAERMYARMLELDPLDAYAQAGLIGLKGQVDPVSTESHLKSIIAAQPDANFLNFTLGNQYAAQGRWAEAQQAYFRAYSAYPEHPDFAYNLAVSLDKMHQATPALQYYRLALKLGESRPATFDRAKVGTRVSQLAR